MCAANVTSQRKALRSQWNNGCEMKRNDGRPVAAHGARLHEPPRAVMLWGIGCRAMAGCVRQILDRAASSITYLRVALGARRRGPFSIYGEHGRSTTMAADLRGRPRFRTRSGPVGGVRSFARLRKVMSVRLTPGTRTASSRPSRRNAQIDVGPNPLSSQARLTVTARG